MPYNPIILNKLESDTFVEHIGKSIMTYIKKKLIVLLNMFLSATILYWRQDHVRNFNIANTSYEASY